MTPTHDISLPELRAHMARQNKRQWQVAAAVGVSSSTFGDYLSGRLRAPPSFRSQVEKVLQLAPGTLRVGAAQTPQKVPA
jgi:hypothetical protein